MKSAAVAVLSLLLVSQTLAQETPSRASRLSERAHQDRDIIYFLQQPETHAFDLSHDYTEAKEGVDKYLNVMRKGSAASNPSARILDTGQALAAETLRGEAITKAGLEIGEPVRPDSEVVVIRFPAVKKGESVRLRISETYTDPKSYRLEGDELVFDRTFGRPRNAVVLPAGWYLTGSSIPATVSETPDGRIRLDFVNPRPDETAVLITAKKRAAKRLSARAVAARGAENFSNESSKSPPVLMRAAAEGRPYRAVTAACD